MRCKNSNTLWCSLITWILNLKRRCVSIEVVTNSNVCVLNREVVRRTWFSFPTTAGSMSSFIKAGKFLSQEGQTWRSCLLSGEPHGQSTFSSLSLHGECYWWTCDSSEQSNVVFCKAGSKPCACRWLVWRLKHCKAKNHFITQAASSVT